MNCLAERLFCCFIKMPDELSAFLKEKENVHVSKSCNRNCECRRHGPRRHQAQPVARAAMRGLSICLPIPRPLDTSWLPAVLTREHCGLGFELRLGTLIVAQMRAHQTFPELAVIRHIKVQQLMHDHVIRKLPIKREQVIAEVQISSRRTGGPFVAHGPNSKRVYMHTELVGPLAHASLYGNARRADDNPRSLQ